MAIVVSDRRMSLALDGTVERALTPTYCGRACGRWCRNAGQAAERNSTGRSTDGHNPFRHFGLKALSVAIAVLLWFAGAERKSWSAAYVRRSNCRTFRKDSSGG